MNKKKRDKQLLEEYEKGIYLRVGEDVDNKELIEKLRNNDEPEHKTSTENTD